MVRDTMASHPYYPSSASASASEVAVTVAEGCGGGDMGMDTNNGMMKLKPAWLERLMAETFFGGCGVHQNQRKNEKNVLCLHCALPLCPHCLPSHATSHPLLQVRRYVYKDVVRLGDLEKLIDCSNIQAYTINWAKVIFLNQRPQTQSRSSMSSSSSSSCKGTTANACSTCDRILQHPFLFCSLSCKVDHMVHEGESLSSILHRFDESDFAFSQFEGLRVDGSEVIDGDTQNAPTSSPSDNEPTTKSVISCEPHHVAAIANMKNKNKNKKTTNNGFFLSLGSRRKGAPHRAPLS